MGAPASCCMLWESAGTHALLANSDLSCRVSAANTRGSSSSAEIYMLSLFHNIFAVVLNHGRTLGPTMSTNSSVHGADAQQLLRDELSGQKCATYPAMQIKVSSVEAVQVGTLIVATWNPRGRLLEVSPAVYIYMQACSCLAVFCHDASDQHLLALADA